MAESSEQSPHARAAEKLSFYSRVGSVECTDYIHSDRIARAVVDPKHRYVCANLSVFMLGLYWML